MRRRLSAVLLAAAFAVSVFSADVYAEETETQAVTESAAETDAEAVSEAESAAETDAEAVSEAESAEEAVTESLSEAESALEEIESEVESELADTGTEEVLDTAGQVKLYMEQYCSQLSMMTEDQIQSMIDNGDETSAKLAYNWQTVQGSLGSFVEMETPAVEVGSTSLTAVARATYDGVDADTVVEVTFNMNQDGTFTMEWDVEYPMSTLLEQAALNTLMGMGIVFLVLIFLSWLIGQLHIIPDLVGGRPRQAEIPAAPAPVSVPAAPVAPAAAPAEEELVNDTELAAVIAAAIAASEHVPVDGFIVRSIKKANKRNWQRA